MLDSVGLLLLPRLRVEAVNAISGPLTWGFPSPTAFTGFVHALGRRLSGRYDFRVEGVGIVCHRFEPLVFQPKNRRIAGVFSLTRNPLDEKGESSSFIEEGRAHLEVSLLVQVRNDFDEAEEGRFAQEAHHAAQGMRLAGGSVIPRGLAAKAGRRQDRLTPVWKPLARDRESRRSVFQELRYSLLPGFALVERCDLLTERLKELQVERPEATALDALLDFSRLNWRYAAGTDDNQSGQWQQVRRKSGWLVPIPVGYQAISPLYEPGVVANARDQQTPFRFVESLYSLGEWVSPHRIEEASQLLWHHHARPESGLYRCTQQPPTDVVA